MPLRAAADPSIFSATVLLRYDALLGLNCPLAVAPLSWSLDCDAGQLTDHGAAPIGPQLIKGASTAWIAWAILPSPPLNLYQQSKLNKAFTVGNVTYAGTR